MKRNFCHQLAPSTSAASNKSWGMARRPVIRISVQNGSDFQMWTPTAMVRAEGEILPPARAGALGRLEQIVGDGETPGHQDQRPERQRFPDVDADRHG